MTKNSILMKRHRSNPSFNGGRPVSSAALQLAAAVALQLPIPIQRAQEPSKVQLIGQLQHRKHAVEQSLALSTLPDDYS